MLVQCAPWSMVVVGFGIKDADSAATISKLAEGVVVGSELIKHIVEAVGAGAGNSKDISAQVSEASKLIAGMRQAMDQ